ncbi:MAG: DNA/RNA nuclease SfsA [Deltaproteobacteria bacterium]|nr:DNA/RNA nuclease SfsA [Deltaproteobacteria bacterium]
MTKGGRAGGGPGTSAASGASDGPAAAAAFVAPDAPISAAPPEAADVIDAAFSPSPSDVAAAAALDAPFLPWPPLVEGRLLRRYKRFLADVELLDGRVVTAHTSNTGRMLDCSEPGRPVFLSLSPNPARRHPYGWEMILMPDGLVGVNTLLPNRLAALALRSGRLTDGRRPAAVRTEPRCGAGRLDLLATGHDGRELWVEVKNCTLVRNSVALFPDAVSLRGARHLEELAALAAAGHRAAVLIMVQRGGAAFFSPADDIDPRWGRVLRQVLDQGVELMVRQVDLSLERAALGASLPARL